MTHSGTCVGGLLAIGLAAILTSCGGSSSNSLLGGPVNPPERPAGTVQGTVLSKVDGRPIPSATIIVSSEVGPTGGFPDNSDFTYGTLTSVDGVYLAPGTPVGLLTMRAFAKGYRTSAPVQFALAADGSIVQDFELEPGEGSNPDGSAYDPDLDNEDDRIGFPFNYDGNYFSYRPDDD